MDWIRIIFRFTTIFVESHIESNNKKY